MRCGGRWAPFVAVGTAAISACGSPDGGEGRPASDTIPIEASDPQMDSASERPVLRDGPTPTLPSSRVAIDNTPVWVEGGTFLMGSDESHPPMAPAHEVTVSSFWIQEHEVTNAEFRRFRPNHPSVDDPDDLPVQYVQWDEAVAYAASLGGSLPTEAQWEYAARGQGGRPYPWGDTNPTCALARYFDCRPRGAVFVMSLPAGATPDGVYDLAGNVAEWVMDRYGPYQAGPVRDPDGPDTGDRRVLRGGGWQTDSTYLSGIARTSWPQQNPADVVNEMAGIGFRVVWSGELERDSIPPVPR